MARAASALAAAAALSICFAAAQGADPPIDAAAADSPSDALQAGAADPDCPAHVEEVAVTEVAPWVWHGGFVLLVVGTALSFWGLAEVTEHYFVPALSVVSLNLGIPDDVAGATLMAAGGSSPEVFSNFISLYITRSQLGAGTIVGSAIFNHLCITACSILASPGGVMQLSCVVVMRDSAFYVLSLLLLLLAVAETGDAAGKACKDWVYIYWYHAAILLLGYVTFVLTCALQRKVHQQCCAVPLVKAADLSELGEAEAGSVSPVPMPPTPQKQQPQQARGGPAAAPAPARPPGRGLLGRIAQLCTSSHPPPAVGGGTAARAAADAHLVVFDRGTVSLWMYKRSRFYAGLSISSHAWQRRWFTVDEHGLRSCRDRQNPSMHLRVFNIFEEASVVVVDPDKMILEVSTKPKRDAPRSHRGYYNTATFRVPSMRALRALIVAINIRRAGFAELPAAERQRLWHNALLHPQACLDGDGGRAASTGPPTPGGAAAEDQQEATLLGEDPYSPKSDVEPEPSALEEATALSGSFLHPPTPQPMLITAVRVAIGVVVFALVTPLKLLIRFTVPNVMHQGNSCVALVMCITWIAGLAFAMTLCLEILGDMMGISAVVMGLTAGGIGTSFPNAYASYLVARQGLGDMAVSNALGSNVFTTLVGLGLPWFCVVFIGSVPEVDYDRHMYHGMPSGGLVFPSLVLLALITLFVLLLWCTGMRLYTWHAWLFLAVYTGFTCWAVFTDCAAPPPFN